MASISTSALINALGGLGVFLLGMIVMTEGLRSLAGDAVRSALMRFTKSPYSGAATGALTTALLQSSSATTVAAVGFVGAGLLTFSQALGIIFGANIGTTITGWMVALLGFKLHLGTIALPIVLIGAILKLFSRGKTTLVGFALAGFGLIFVGIGLLQEGMSGIGNIITPEYFPHDSLSGRLELVGLGIVATLITQSSSAGVAATLAALYGGTINFEQAAALVIGMDVGTTFTAVMASIGGSDNVKRTGLSHVIYNLMTGVMAFFLIGPFVYLWKNAVGAPLADNAQIALVAFHTSFNTLGVLLILPFTRYFARLMQRIIPSRELYSTGKLDQRLFENEPVLALHSARNAIQEECVTLFQHMGYLLGDTQNGKAADMVTLENALDETQRYIDTIQFSQDDAIHWQQIIILLHLVDHAQRLHERCSEEEVRARTARLSSEMDTLRQHTLSTIFQTIAAIKGKHFSQAKKIAAFQERKAKKLIKACRRRLIEQIAHDEIDDTRGIQRLEAVRWLARTHHHLTRIAYYLDNLILESGK